VKAESWSRTWIIVPPPPPPPQPSQCDRILNDPNRVGSPEWCACARLFGDPRANEKCPTECTYCFTASVKPCCVGADRATGCLNSWSGSAGRDCRRLPCENPPSTSVELQWRAEWSLKPGWSFNSWGWAPNDGVTYCNIEVRGPSAGGMCRSTIPPSRHIEIVIVFKQTS
jgi:hypothetical protein